MFAKGYCIQPGPRHARPYRPADARTVCDVQGNLLLAPGRHVAGRETRPRLEGGPTEVDLHGSFR